MPDIENEAKVLPETLYVESAWFSDCDPFMSVIATSPEICKAALDGGIAEEAERWLDSKFEEDENSDATIEDAPICVSGVFPEDRDGLLLEMSPRERQEAIRVLIEDGYYHPEIY